MRSSVVTTNEIIRSAYRLTGGYYSSAGQLIRDALTSSPLKLETVADVAERIFIGGRARRVYVQDPDWGIPFVSSADMLRADLTGVLRVSRRAQPGLPELILEEGWTLISRSGTVGNVVYAGPTLAGVAGSEHIMRVVPNGGIAPGYLAAWLSSFAGKSLITQGVFGSIVPTVEPPYVAKLPIPRLAAPLESTNHRKMVQAAHNRAEANRRLEQAR